MEDRSAIEKFFEITLPKRETEKQTKEKSSKSSVAYIYKENKVVKGKVP